MYNPLSSSSHRACVRAIWSGYILYSFPKLNCWATKGDDSPYIHHNLWWGRNEVVIIYPDWWLIAPCMNVCVCVCLFVLYTGSSCWAHEPHPILLFSCLLHVSWPTQTTPWTSCFLMGYDNTVLQHKDKIKQAPSGGLTINMQIYCA